MKQNELSSDDMNIFSGTDEEERIIHKGVISTLKKLHDPATAGNYSIENLVCLIRKHKSVDLISEEILDVFKLYRLKDGFMAEMKKAVEEYDGDEEILSALVLLLIHEWHLENDSSVSNISIRCQDKCLEDCKVCIKQAAKSILSLERKRRTIYYDAMIEVALIACETFPEPDMIGDALLRYLQGYGCMNQQDWNFPEWLTKYACNVYNTFRSPGTIAPHREYEITDHRWYEPNLTYFLSFKIAHLKILECMNVFGNSDIFNNGNPDSQKVITEKTVYGPGKLENTRIKEIFCNDKTIVFNYPEYKNTTELITHPNRHEYKRFRIVKELIADGYYLPALCIDFRSFVYNDIYQSFAWHLKGEININVGFLKEKDIWLDFHQGYDLYSLFLEDGLDHEMSSDVSVYETLDNLPYDDGKPYLCLQIKYFENNFNFCNQKALFSELTGLVPKNSRCFIDKKHMFIICPLKNGVKLFNTCMNKEKFNTAYEKMLNNH